MSKEVRSLYETSRRSGLSQEEIKKFYEKHDGKCEICGIEAVAEGRKRLCVDHCHKTEKFRGLLCGNCNLAIGNMRDNPFLLRAAADYLERKRDAGKK